MPSGLRIVAFFAAVLAVVAVSCGREKPAPLDASSLRGMPKDQIQQMREEIYARHSDGSALTDSETQRVEVLRDQERRLENAWILGEWRERHGRRLIFRDDGSVSVGAKSGAYDELGVYKYISPEEPSYEAVWSVRYDTAGDPVIVVPQPSGEDLLYPFHKDRVSVYERTGDLQVSRETGCYYTKNQ